MGGNIRQDLPDVKMYGNYFLCFKNKWNKLPGVQEVLAKCGSSCRLGANSLTLYWVRSICVIKV
jgi:hypothetical protein